MTINVKLCQPKKSYDNDLFSEISDNLNTENLGEQSKKYIFWEIEFLTPPGECILIFGPRHTIFFWNSLCPLLDDQKQIPLAATIPTRHRLSSMDQIGGAIEDWSGKNLDVLGQIIVIFAKTENVSNSIWIVFHP